MPRCLQVRERYRYGTVVQQSRRDLRRGKQRAIAAKEGAHTVEVALEWCVLQIHVNACRNACAVGLLASQDGAAVHAPLHSFIGPLTVTATPAVCWHGGAASATARHLVRNAGDPSMLAAPASATGLAQISVCTSRALCTSMARRSRRCRRATSHRLSVHALDRLWCVCGLLPTCQNCCGNAAGRTEWVLLCTT